MRLKGKKDFIRVKMAEEESRRKPFFQSFDISFSNLIADFQREIGELKRGIKEVSEENVCLRAEVAEYKKSYVPNNVALWKQSMNQLEKESKSHEFTAKQLQKAVEEAAMWKGKYNLVLKDNRREVSKEFCEATTESTDAPLEQNVSTPTIEMQPSLPSAMLPEQTSLPPEAVVDPDQPILVEKPTSVFKPITIKGKDYLFGVEDNYVYEIEEGGLPGLKKYIKEGGKYKKVVS